VKCICLFNFNITNKCSLRKMSKNMNKRATKRKSATENSMLKFLTVSSVSSDSIVKGIIDDKIAYMYTFKIMFDTSVIQ
jgi:hypothetical protein